MFAYSRYRSLVIVITLVIIGIRPYPKHFIFIDSFIHSTNVYQVPTMCQAHNLI